MHLRSTYPLPRPRTCPFRCLERSTRRWRYSYLVSGARSCAPCQCPGPIFAGWWECAKSPGTRQAVQCCVVPALQANDQGASDCPLPVPQPALHSFRKRTSCTALEFPKFERHPVVISATASSGHFTVDWTKQKRRTSG
ncbi:hypothetical protein B0H12DRAFT_286553 [Mycena haematopus]|nr:hypothetical protein B0H12DRAFT_286553 [Mycena haematopus]